MKLENTSKILTLFIETPRLRVFLPKQLTRGTSTQSRELATVSAKTGRHHLHPNRHQYAHRQDHRRPSPELFPFSFMNRFLGELSHRAGQGRHSPSSSPYHHRVACHYRACCQCSLESTALPKTGCTAPFFVFFETGFLSDLGHTVLPSTLRQPPPEALVMRVLPGTSQDEFNIPPTQPQPSSSPAVPQQPTSVQPSSVQPTPVQPSIEEQDDEDGSDDNYVQY
ncbi:hypothetical protein LR48_Vigan07g199600 [Vigna angularis]|uniref:Uncharacterized protein n=1 Tax=Phaseolus angularis TaxID=3914 RepID=A0A0L9V097_PHAAN|nr:hypothetical protein LR48_Vigan07g199600 [Vigna angularis]